MAGVSHDDRRPSAGPDDGALLFRAQIDRAWYEAEGRGLLLNLEPNWEEAVIVVGAVVNLGF